MSDISALLSNDESLYWEGQFDDWEEANIEVYLDYLKNHSNKTPDNYFILQNELQIIINCVDKTIEFNNWNIFLEYTNYLVQGNLEGILIVQGYFVEAIYFLKVALELYKESDDKKSICHIYTTLGKVHEKQGDYKLALEILEQALSIARELNLKLEILIILTELSNCFTESGDIRKSMTLLDEAADIGKELDDKESLASIFHTLAINLMSIGNYEAARKFYNEKLKIKQEINPQTSNMPFSAIGIPNYTDPDNSAYDYFTKELIIAEKLNDKRSMCLHLSNLGDIATQRKEYDLAKDYIDRALNLAIELRYKQGTVNALMQQGYLAYCLKDYETSAYYYNYVLPLAEEIEDKIRISTCCLMLGILARLNKNYDDALNFLDKAHLIYTEILDQGGAASCDFQIGMLMQVQGEFKLADTFLNQSLAAYQRMNKQDEEEHLYRTLGMNSLIAQDFDSSIKYYTKVLEININTGNTFQVLQMQVLLGKLFMNLNNSTEAIRYWDESKKTYESLESKDPDTIEAMRQVDEWIAGINS